jgi:quercetin dioxygenase-like cupin family protein
VRTRSREAEAQTGNPYEMAYRHREQQAERQRTGQIVVKPSERPYFMSRQGRLRFYLCPLAYPNTALEHWRVFTHEIRTKSGRHRHQGGLVIYVLDGIGYSIVEGERVEWKKGDLLLLPMKPGGVEHQHFNLDPEKPATWVAFVPIVLTEHVASTLQQTEQSPEYKQ